MSGFSPCSSGCKTLTSYLLRGGLTSKSACLFTNVDVTSVLSRHDMRQENLMFRVF